MLNDNFKIAVVIVTFNRCDELVKTISAIKNQGIIEYDIIVINNNSTDNTKNILDSNYKNIQSIHLNENIASAGGFSKGMQTAFEKGYDWVWLFNDDSRPVEGSLKSILTHLNSDKIQIGLLKIANKDENNKAVLLYWNGVRKPVSVDVSNEIVQTDLITFDGCIISKKTIEKIGYCDPLYFMGTYEFDYCLKAKDAGIGVYTLPNGLIEDGKLGGKNGTPPWRQYYNTRNHLWLALNRKSFVIFKGWLIREIKYTLSIILSGDKKIMRLVFKLRAIRDAFLNKRGKRYDPVKYK
ncbi:glycosyltransferase [Flavobacterium sp.]|jgi:GT2 family glycosyltransferase|uniref:glycosyltransferase n=1 Tax=Flavobacterium sp. TaxID=239 RepID=UPI0037C14BD2